MAEAGAEGQERAEVAEQFDDIGQQITANLAGMWLFLATEIMFFGGLFTAFAVYRTRHAEAFAEAAGHLHLWLGAANTAILLTSGLAMALADPAMRRDSRRGALAAIAATLLLGLAFLGIKAYEYSAEFAEGLMPILGLPFRYEGAQPAQAEMFFDLYYALTGLHALHMLIGIGLLALIFVLVWRWRDPARLTRQVQISALYWAFVDVVWLFVFPTLYLLGGGGG